MSVTGISLPAQNTYYRSIWISDFHLGTKRCKSQALLTFLRSHCAENLFLVGDVIDCWNVGPGWHWDRAQTAVVEEIWAWRRRGTRITFLPGNHDETNSDLIRTLFGQIECAPQTVHRTAEGRRMLVVHGHQFDGSIHPARWLSVMGSATYSAALKLNLWYNRERVRSSTRRIRPVACVRRRLKQTVHRLIDFDDRRVYDAARLEKVDGIICGHTHRPDYRNVGPFLYVNDGDWVQSRTALVEQADGTLRLLCAEPNAASPERRGYDYEPFLCDSSMAETKNRPDLL